MKEQKELRRAKDYKCSSSKCDNQAEVFYPVFDPDIPSYPYCRKCVRKLQLELLKSLDDIDKRYESNRSKH